MSEEMTNELQFHHIGIIVKDLNAAIERYITFSGSKKQGYYYEFVRSQKVNICMVPLAEDYIIYVMKSIM